MTESPFGLSGKVPLVTGGNSGIGLAMAEAMACASADSCIWGTNVDKNAVALETLAPVGRELWRFGATYPVRSKLTKILPRR